MLCKNCSFLAPEDLSCSCKYSDEAGKECEVPWVPNKFQSVNFTPSYNMGPRDIVPCLVAGSHFNNESERVLCPMMWGMIPPWHQVQYALIYNTTKKIAHNFKKMFDFYLFFRYFTKLLGKGTFYHLLASFD